MRERTFTLIHLLRQTYLLAVNYLGRGPPEISTNRVLSSAGEDDVRITQGEMHPLLIVHQFYSAQQLWQRSKEHRKTPTGVVLDENPYGGTSLENSKSPALTAPRACEYAGTLAEFDQETPSTDQTSLSGDSSQYLLSIMVGPLHRCP